jgi:hypothetical protein
LDQSSATDYVQSAREIVHLLDLAGSMPGLLSQITAVIRVYERGVLGEVTWQA